MATDQLVTLNVGGTVYETRSSTLTKYPHSVLAQMFSLENTRPDTDQYGRTFIDRDGALFRYVLNFLRTDYLLLPDNFQEISLLGAEVEFYKISRMTEAIQKWKLKNTVTVEERVFEQSGRMHPGSYVDWLIQGNRSCILWLSESGIFGNQDDENDPVEVTISDDGGRIHRSWYNDIRMGVTQGGYQYSFCKPDTPVQKECIFKEIANLGYKLNNKIKSVTPPEIHTMVKPFVHFKSDKSNTYTFELFK